jgi:hypothetical protein
MKFESIIKYSFKSIGREVGLDIKNIDGRLVCTPIDPDDPRYSLDFVLPSMKMIQACRADDFPAFHPFIEAGKITLDDMHQACARYFLGKTKSGTPMYWMIDDFLQPLDAHIGTTAWLSRLLKSREPLLEHWRITHCLFGLHLLMEDVNPQPISVVESEEAAVVLSELFPESIWMAYATTSHLSPDLLAPLQGRTATIYPRTDPTMSTYLFFLDYADLVRKNYDIDLHIDSTLEDHATPDQKERCIDILDFILESINKQ